MLFVVDEILQERQYECGFPSLADAALELGHNVLRTKYVPFTSKLDIELPDIEQPILAYGTVQFIRNFNNTFKGLCPGVYQNDIVRSFHKFAVPLNDYLLNDDYIIVPYYFIRTGKYADQSIFAKPLSGLKQFTGKAITPKSFKDDIETMNKFEHIDDDLLCVVSSVKDIQAEFRYIIADKQVITGSEYRWDNVLDVRIDTLPECDKMAQHIASLDWQADTVYVCDVAMTNNGPKVIELNSFSSSGLYACDTYKIVEAVAKTATREYNGDIDV